MKTILLLLALLGLSNAAIASTTTTFGGASIGLPMNGRLASARTAPLGAGFTGLADDSSALLWNPAGLSILRRGQVGLHHHSWVADILQETVLFAVPTERWGGIGVLANYVNYGLFVGRSSTGAPTRALGASDIGLGIGWGRHMAGPVHAGLVFRRQQQTLAYASYETYSADVGVLLRFSDQWGFGLTVANLGTELGSPGTGAIRAGGAWSGVLSNNMGVSASVGYHSENGARDRANMGVEFHLNPMLTLRGGYEHYFGDVGVDGFTGLIVGFGLAIDPVRLDYAYIPVGVLGDGHRVSLVYRFGSSGNMALEPEPQPEPKPEAPKPVARPPEIEVPSQPPAPPPLPVRPEPTPTHATRFLFKVPPSQFRQAKELERQGRYREAIATYNIILKKDPRSVRAWRGLADLYFRLGRKSFALRCYEEVVRLNPSDTRLKAWLEEYRQAEP